MIILKNDTFIERKDALIDMEDRGFQFGDGVYEVIRIYNGKFFLLEDHLKRLQYSLNEAQLDVDLAKRGNKEKLIELAEKIQLMTVDCIFKSVEASHPEIICSLQTQKQQSLLIRYH